MRTRTEADSITFAGYEQRGSNTVAKFRNLFPNYKDGRLVDGFVMSKVSCEGRLQTLQKGGLPHEEIAKAVVGWPSE